MMTTTSPAADGDYHFMPVPMLLSMSHIHLASRAISEAIAMGGIGYHSSSSSSPEYHFRRSLHHWPTNPVAHSLFTNYRRMNGSSSLVGVCDMYQRATSYASCWRMLALDFLGRSLSAAEEGVTEDDNVTVGDGIDANKWVELLILNAERRT
ncbi:hypothetical protein ACHAXA_001929 [Cyclostephanos tholiformis]|jgi:hypothetical protein|uniref:Uncharacterized protein n=1 Tax=Cyclostephanos tholiformis TaxID=382380 RepID=A0ABD3RC99_9STRA